MNWRRGLFRLWVIVSVVWATLAVYTKYVDCSWYGPQVLCFDDLLPYQFDDRVAWIVGPPLAVLLIGLGIVWCIQGFRPG
jgi:hypothetical protein